MKWFKHKTNVISKLNVFHYLIFKLLTSWTESGILKNEIKADIVGISNKLYVGKTTF